MIIATTSPATLTRELILQYLIATFDDATPAWSTLGAWNDALNRQDWFVYVGEKRDENNDCVAIYDTGGQNNDGDTGRASIMIYCRATSYLTSYGFLSALKARLDLEQNYNNIVGYEITGDINAIGKDTQGRYECTLNYICYTNTI